MLSVAYAWSMALLNENNWGNNEIVLMQLVFPVFINFVALPKYSSLLDLLCTISIPLFPHRKKVSHIPISKMLHYPHPVTW